MTTIDLNDQINLNCLDIVKDSEGANIYQINEAKNDLVLGSCDNSPNLTIVKNSIINSYEKLFPIINNGNKSTKINVNLKNFFIDAGWGKKIINRYLSFESTDDEFYYCQTPATYSDPGKRPRATKTIEINHTFDLKQLGLNAKVTYKSDELNSKTNSFIEIIIEPVNGDPYDKINCKLNSKQIIVESLSNTKPNKHLFQGNRKKKEYINQNYKNYTTQYRKNRNAFVICKEIGDTMQAMCLQYILQNNKNPNSQDEATYLNSALLTNDSVLAARSMTLGIPYILLSAATGLVKYYMPGDKKFVNASFFETYISNALLNNKQQLDLLEEWKMDNGIIKIAASIDSYYFNQDLRNLVNRFKECIENCNNLLNLINSNFEKIDFSDDNTLKNFKILTSLLTVKKMVFKVKEKFIINNKFKEFLNNSFLKILDLNIKVNVEKQSENSIRPYKYVLNLIKSFIYKSSSQQNTTSTIIEQTINDFINNIIEKDDTLKKFYENIKQKIELKINNSETLDIFIIKYCKQKSNGGKKSVTKKKYQQKYIIKKSKKKLKKKKSGGTKRKRSTSRTGTTSTSGTVTKRKRSTSGTGKRSTSGYETDSSGSMDLQKSNEFSSPLQNSKAEYESEKISSLINAKSEDKYSYSYQEDVLSIYSILFPFIYINPYIYYYLLQNEKDFNFYIQKINKKEDLIFIYDLIINNEKFNESLICICENNLLHDQYGDSEDIDELLTEQFKKKIDDILKKLK